MGMQALTENRGEHESCEACGGGRGEGPLATCGCCGALLHEDCRRYAGCPTCPQALLPDPWPYTPAPVSRNEPDASPPDHIGLRRLAARGADTLVLLLPSLLVLAVSQGLLGLPAWLVFLGATSTALGMDLLNKGLFRGEGGATLGEKLLDIRVTDPIGQPMGWRRSLRRSMLLERQAPLQLSSWSSSGTGLS